MDYLPGISLAMIVRNEARCLARCLESVRGVVDQIIVVDTGSTDGTVEIAERWGAEVHHRKWSNDFSAARNASLEHVRHAWTLWLDADEWWVESARSGLRRAIQMEAAMAFLLVRRDVQADGRWGEQALLRLWRSGPTLRFEGVIHEHLNADALTSAFPGKEVIMTDLAFWHDGFSAERSRAKLERNVQLLIRELELRPGQIYYEIELLRAWEELGDPAAAELEQVIQAKLLAKQDEEAPPCDTVALFLATRLTGLASEELASYDTGVLLRLSRGWFPRNPTLWVICAQAEIQRNNLRQAFQDLLAAEQLTQTGDYDRTFAANPALIQEGLWTNLALVAHQLGRAEVARRNYLRLLERDPGNALARQNLTLLG